MASIRDILESFVKRTKQMYQFSSLNDHGEPLDEFEKEFQRIREESLRHRTERTFATDHGQHETNNKKNRYKDILPYDHTRVVLSKTKDDEHSDYINANWVKGAMNQPVYVAAQGPLPTTVTDFWRMLWEYEINIIIMLCNEYEGRKLKCQKYWVDDNGTAANFGDIRVSLEREETTLSNCRVRHLKAEANGQCRRLIQFHYNAWPDHGIPDQVSPILDMVAMVREYQPGDNKPIVVHCSAGCGRTGTVIAIDFCWNLLKMGLLNKDFKLYDIISDMRCQRPSFVQTKEQYMLVHKAVMELYQRHLDLMDDHIYTNMLVSAEENVYRQITVQQQQQNMSRTSTVYSVANEPMSTSSPTFRSVERWVCQNKQPEKAPPAAHQQPSPKQRRSYPANKSSPGHSSQTQQQSPNLSKSPHPVAQPRKPPTSPKPTNTSAGTASRPGSSTNQEQATYCASFPVPKDKVSSSTSDHHKAQPQARPRSSGGHPAIQRPGVRIVHNKSYGMQNGQASNSAKNTGSGEYSLANVTGNSMAFYTEENDLYNQPVDAVGRTNVAGEHGICVYADPTGSPEGPAVPKKNLDTNDVPEPKEIAYAPTEYSYADPDRSDKWHLQPMAKHLLENPKLKKSPAPVRDEPEKDQTPIAEPYEQVEIDRNPQCLKRPDLIPEAYSEVSFGQTAEPCVTQDLVPASSEYSAVQWRPRHDSSSEEEAPPVPSKLPSLATEGQRSSLGKEDRLDRIPEKSTDDKKHEKSGAVLKKLKNAWKGNEKGASNMSNVAVSSQTPVYFKGKDISYGNRVEKPAGPRSYTHATAH